MSEEQTNSSTQENSEEAAENQPATAKKMTPLEAIKARQAAMNQGRGGQGKRSNGNSEGAGAGGPTKKPTIQQRKMG